MGKRAHWIQFKVLVIKVAQARGGFVEAAAARRSPRRNLCEPKDEITLCLHPSFSFALLRTRKNIYKILKIYNTYKILYCQVFVSSFTQCAYIYIYIYIKFKSFKSPQKNMEIGGGAGGEQEFLRKLVKSSVDSSA